MINFYKKIGTVWLSLLFCFYGAIGWGQDIKLKVVGNAEDGFNVNI